VKAVNDQQASQQGRSYFELGADEDKLSLYRAAQWLALKGEPGWVSLEETEGAAKTLLFPTLASSALVANSLSLETMTDSHVPADRWAFVTTNPNKAGQFLNWINDWHIMDAATSDYEPDQFGGQLTRAEDRSKNNDPFSGATWVNITITRDDLRRVFGANGTNSPLATSAAAQPSPEGAARLSIAPAGPRSRGSRIDDARALKSCRELLEKKGAAWRLQGLAPEWQAAVEIGFSDNPNDADAARRATKRLSNKLKNGKPA
jgi:hypothetical protein